MRAAVVRRGAAAEPATRRAARATLAWAVRGGGSSGGAPGPQHATGAAADAAADAVGAAGGIWGEAILAEFDETRGRWEAIRWTAGGIRVAWRERRGGRGLFAPAVAALWYGGWRRRLLVVALAAIVLLAAANQVVLTTAYQPSSAMEPTLRAGDRALVDLVGFRLGGVHRGDVVLVDGRVDDRGAADPGRFTFRVLGLPGDTISCVDGAVRRNGTAVDEPYLAADTRTECAEITVPPGRLYLLGDNRDVARDSRSWGPVDEAGVVGVVWPVTSFPDGWLGPLGGPPASRDAPVALR